MFHDRVIKNVFHQLTDIASKIYVVEQDYKLGNSLQHNIVLPQSLFLNSIVLHFAVNLS